MRPCMETGGRYNWRNQPERLIYLGKNWSGNGFWHQFSLVEDPETVWCEVLDSDLENFEETPPAPVIKPQFVRRISPRQERKQRKAAKRAQQREVQPNA
ncbi:hypothetical protein [Comamonas sp.]|uniref:hypothetical protein n=1 Tax=Comamonas sp. TaxID=34028 RepID=UPI0028AF8C24|nr:hypothetical protein [Comamonas sp.]